MRTAVLTSLFSLFLFSCSTHEGAAILTDIAASNAQGYNDVPRTPSDHEDKSLPLEISIQLPAENSRVTPPGVSLSGRCNLNGSRITIFLDDQSEKVATSICETGRWVSTVVAYEKIPRGHFQLFAKMHADPDRSASSSRSFEK